MSKSFKFSLKKVLKYKSDREDIKSNDLKKVKNILKIEKDNLQKLLCKKDAHLGENQKLKNEDNISLDKLKASAAYLDQLNDKISSQDKKVGESNQKVEKVRKDLIEISKSRKILEKLREKQYQDYKDLSKKEERRIESEIAIRKRTRNNGD